MAEQNHDKDIDDISGVETTGHSWDGIKELNNPMPRWWVWTFYATILWGLVYTILYPAWPLVSSSTAGILGWSSRGDVASEIVKADEAKSVMMASLVEADLNSVPFNADLVQFSMAGGSAAFKVNCVQCHGSGAAGGGGYPNLNDDDWIWGGTVEELYQTIAHGIRHESDPDTRLSEMPRYGVDEILPREDIVNVAWYVRQLSGQEHDAQAAAAGAIVFEENCAACHGDAGEGVHELGAPNLADAIWLYGGSHEELVAQISNPQQGVMPGWAERLGEGTVRQLAVYVHQLGGGEQPE